MSDVGVGLAPAYSLRFPSLSPCLLMAFQSQEKLGCCEHKEAEVVVLLSLSSAAWSADGASCPPWGPFAGGGLASRQGGRGCCLGKAAWAAEVWDLDIELHQHHPGPVYLGGKAGLEEATLGACPRGLLRAFEVRIRGEPTRGRKP